MKVLITGGAGFVGSTLARAIRQRWEGAEVVCMDNLYRRGSELNVGRLRQQGIAFHHGDVRQRDDFPAGPFDVLLECSAEPSVLSGLGGKADYLLHTNLTGAYHCLEAARQWGARFLFLSTSRIYPIATLESQPWTELATRFAWQTGTTPGLGPTGVSEDCPLAGARSLYGWTKYAAELLIEEYRAAWGVRAIVNRCGVIAGPGQFGKVDQGVVTLWVMAHHFGRNLQYVGYGGQGKQVRDILHVQDLCDLVLLQLEDFDSWEGWVGNVAGGPENSVSLCELTELCRQATGREISLASRQETRPADLRIFIGDCRRLHARTAWRPRRSCADTVHDIAAWVADNAAELRSLPS